MEREKELNELRAQIRQVDEELLTLMARRQALASQVGKAKLTHGLPIKDYGTEKNILENTRRRAKELGLYEETAEEVMKTLIQYSCEVQEAQHGQARALSSGSRRQVAIVGGMGQMGQWLTRFFESFGHRISTFDAKGGDSSLQQIAEKAEVILLATPISATPGVLENLIALKPKGLVFDVCSLKSPLLPAIARARKAGLKITSVHPMFGPSAEWLAGRNILICETGDEAATKEAWQLFQESSATLLKIPLERHDELMGYVLGLSHLTNLVFGTALEKSGLKFEEFKKTGSTTFHAQAQVAEPVLAENPDLYFEIQAENGHTKSVLAGMKAALEEYSSAIQAKDRAGFRRLMENSRKYFRGN